MYDYDLNMRTNSIKVQGNIGCNPVQGIMAEPGKTLGCTIIYGSNTHLHSPVIINIINF
jgi:hypothetical protein